MALYRVPFRGGILSLDVPVENIAAVLERHPVPALGDLAGAVRKALDEPIGTLKLSETVGPGDKVAFLSGPYPYASLVGSVVLDELYRAGVREEDVTLVIAVGTHVHSEEANRRTLGALMRRVGRTVAFDSVGRDDLAFVGVTRYGNPTWVSRYMVESDFNIGIGDVTPGLYGFRGGAKIISPGCSGFETIAYNHRLYMAPGAVAGDINSPVSLDMEESARLAGLDVKVDLVSNGAEGEGAGYAGVFAGDFAEEKRAALPLVRRVFGTRMRERADIAVLLRRGDATPTEHLFSGIYTAVAFAAQAVKDDGIVIPVFSAWGGYHPEEPREMWGHPSSMHEADRLARLRLEDLARVLVRCECNVRCGANVYPHRRAFEQRRVFLVTEGLTKEDGTQLGAAYTTVSFDEALAKALMEKGKDARIVVHSGEWGCMPLID